MSFLSSTQAPTRTAKPMFSLLLSGLLAGAAVIGGAPGEALASENCKNVKIIFTNATNAAEITITDFWYYDKDAGDHWRSEVVGNKTIKKGLTGTYTNNLEKANNEVTQIKFKYKWPNGSRTEYSKHFTCTSNMTVSVQVNGTNDD